MTSNRTSTPRGRPDGPHRYEIRLQGQLDARWSALFEGLRLTTGGGVTLLEGVVVDQAALHGLLHQLRDTGLPLVSLTRVPPEGGREHSPSCADSAPHPSDTTSPGA